MILSDYFETDFTAYILGYYLIMEVVSILENVSFFIPVPDKIKSILNNDQIEKTNKEETVTTVEETVTTASPEILKFIEEEEKKKDE